MIRVLVADDQTLFRTMLTQLLEKHQDINVIASAANGYEAVEMAELHKPDIVLLDIEMPDQDGITAAAKIKQLLPDTKIAILTTFEDVGNVTAAASAGADAYLIKDIEPDILVMAIKCILHDLAIVHQSAFSILFPDREVSCVGNGVFSYDGHSFDKTDIMIFKLLAQGRSNREIAQVLHYSEGTIKNRISSLLAVTKSSDRSALAVFALKNQIV